MIVLTYTKLKEILDRYPHCFKTVKEKEEEFDRLVERIEKGQLHLSGRTA